MLGCSLNINDEKKNIVKFLVSPIILVCIMYKKLHINYIRLTRADLNLKFELITFF